MGILGGNFYPSNTPDRTLLVLRAFHTTFSVADLASVVQTLDSTIHWINHYPEDKYLVNQLRYPLDRDLFSG